MDISFREIEELLPGYLSGEMPDEDRAIIDQWRNESVENEAFYNEIRKAWEAMPLLHEMEQFNSFEALNCVHARLQEPENRKWWNSIQQVAAMLLLPILIYSGYVTTRNLSLEKLQKDHVIMQTISSRQGMVSQFTMEDGTKVWLNSGSELQFPTHFNGKMREVKLRGEAFFEVSKNKNQPFRVNARELQIDVLGTKFNVSNYDDDLSTEVTLIEGKVKLSEEKDQVRKEYCTMHPGERVIYNEENKNVHSIDVEVSKYIAWRDGELIFRDDNMEDVVKRLSRWYNVEIVINDSEISNYVYQATFRNETLSQVLNLLEISAPISYRIVDSKVLPNGEFTKQKVYLMKKQN